MSKRYTGTGEGNSGATGDQGLAVDIVLRSSIRGDSNVANGESW